MKDQTISPVPITMQRQRRHRSRRHGPLFPTIFFSLLGLNWLVLVTIGLIYLRPHPLSTADHAVGALGGLFGVFYFWVAYAVYKRRRYILDVALACAGLGLLSIPIGTLISIALLQSLVSRKHDFTR